MYTCTHTRSYVATLVSRIIGGVVGDRDKEGVVGKFRISGQWRTNYRCSTSTSAKIARAPIYQGSVTGQKFTLRNGLKVPK